jgi:hypothetical protein
LTKPLNILPGDELHPQEQSSASLADLKNLVDEGDEGMIERGGGQGFAAETFMRR